MRKIFASAAFSFLLLTGFAQTSVCDVPLHLNQIQVVGSHNSYRMSTDKGVMRALKLLEKIKPLDVRELDYSHLPLEMQFDSFGIRSIEIDIYNDPQGGNFYKRYGNRLAFKSANSKVEELKKPGMKVLHIPDIDYNTQFYTFREAMQRVKKWSDLHPGHIPIFILVETKGESIGDHVKGVKFTQAVPWDADACNNIDNEIDEVFGKNSSQVLRPDDVRGNYATLNEAVTKGYWPMLNSALGKIVFIMEGGAENLYIQGNNEGLKGRNMFVYSEPGKPECAFIIRNDSRRNKTVIKELVGKGYMVRTRSDSGTTEARYGDYSGCKAALGSGAQIVSTDYYRPDPRSANKKSGWSNYHVSLPNKAPARINPVLDIPCKGSCLKEPQ
ncbi:MAG: phosphatidylinositol-specific phospholipase C1-like protein [Sphingobacteriales bacterium JAD_PAG50586_3]|nr:MAG: phosphatidylinositol-specific phospholipase C1-like protein [Sphingobacteriales bacterium JAD_PAG50586_3]